MSKTQEEESMQAVPAGKEQMQTENQCNMVLSSVEARTVRSLR